MAASSIAICEFRSSVAVMRVFCIVLALAVAWASVAGAKDQAEEQDGPRPSPSESVLEASDEEQDSRPDRPRSHDDVQSEDALRGSEGVEQESSFSELDNPSDSGRVKVDTAPVPVKTLGITPANAPKTTPGPKAREAETRKVRIGQIAAAATPGAKIRKARSEEILRAAGVPLNLKLPAIVDVGQTTGRTHREVVGRTLAILATAVKGEGLEQKVVDALIEDFGVREYLSPNEAAFIAQSNPSMIDRVQFAWRYEAAWTLLWAISAVDELQPPSEIVDVRAIGAIVRGETVDTFMLKTSLRPMEELLDEADLIYRYRWALVDAQLRDDEPPADLDPGVALERHRALNWLIGYLNQDWDDVTPDT